MLKPHTETKHIIMNIQPPSGGCVLKHTPIRALPRPSSQPPSGGCVLKRFLTEFPIGRMPQPPSGGCVLKHPQQPKQERWGGQPPSGGCVLKHGQTALAGERVCPAAFRRLCVETVGTIALPLIVTQPPSGGCVLKPRTTSNTASNITASRLQAAVC